MRSLRYTAFQPRVSAAKAENFRYKRLLETGDFLFEKNINEITSEDIDNLIQRSIGESETLELKKDLPTKGNRPDPWYDGNGIGDYARNRLLTEVIAFANSFGGILLLGIEETAEAPPRASAVNLIPRCSKLALRLEQQASMCIEPQIPGMRVRGVPYDEDDKGIVLFMINRSTYLAPHRLKQTLHCYTRRGERTEELTMREIRDLVLTTRNLTDYIEQNFQKGADQFETPFARVKKVNENVRAFSVTAVPLDPDRVNLDIQKEVELPQNAFRGVG